MPTFQPWKEVAFATSDSQRSASDARAMKDSLEGSGSQEQGPRQARSRGLGARFREGPGRVESLSDWTLTFMGGPFRCLGRFRRAARQATENCSVGQGKCFGFGAHTIQATLPGIGMAGPAPNKISRRVSPACELVCRGAGGEVLVSPLQGPLFLPSPGL